MAENSTKKRKPRGLRSDGRVQVTYTDGRRPDGKPNRISFFGRNRSEAEAKRQEYIDHKKAGLSWEDRKLTVNEWVDRWIELYKVKAAHLGVSVLGYLTGIVGALVALLFFFYFLTRPDMRGKDYVAEMPFLKDDTKAFVAEQIDAFLDIVVSFFQRQVVICLLEGGLYGLGFAVVGLPYGFIIGFILGVLNLVPFFGSVVCLPIALSLAYFGADGSTWRVAGVVLVWGAGQLLDGYVITPKIQGDKTGLGYAGVIFSFFFWGAVFQSLLGLLLAIPLSAFCVVLWRALKSKYIKPVV